MIYTYLYWAILVPIDEQRLTNILMKRIFSIKLIGVSREDRRQSPKNKEGVKIVKNSELFKKCRNPVEKALEDYQDSRTVPENMTHLRWSLKGLWDNISGGYGAERHLRRQRQLKAKLAYC